MTDSFIKSRPLDVWRWTEYPELRDCLGDLAAEIDTIKKRKRARSTDDAKRFRDALRTLVLDLFVAWKTDPALQVGVPLGASAFNPGSRYHAFHLTYRPCKAAFDGLRTLGYLVIDKKGNINRATGKSYRTRVRATDKLIEKLIGRTALSIVHVHRNPDEETIILKDQGKKRIGYQDTPETFEMRKRLGRINRVLSRCWIDIDLTDAEFRDLDKLLVKRGQDDPYSPTRNGLDVTARTLHRVFNNGTFKDGGRFYGGWWQNVPREYRMRIKINDKSTVELDYSGIHARILYAKEGLNFPDDPFNKIGFGDEHRQLVKECFYALINCDNRGVREFPEFKAAKLGLSWTDFCSRVMEAHAPIQHYFKSGYGVKLMRTDSDIAERVMLHFADYGIPTLPVHDSFLMHHGYEKELQEVMAAAFLEVVGKTAEIPVKKKEVEGDTGDRGLDESDIQPVDWDFDRIFEVFHERSIYEGRLSDWRRSTSGGNMGSRTT